MDETDELHDSILMAPSSLYSPPPPTLHASFPPPPSPCLIIVPPVQSLPPQHQEQHNEVSTSSQNDIRRRLRPRAPKRNKSFKKRLPILKLIIPCYIPTPTVPCFQETPITSPRTSPPPATSSPMHLSIISHLSFTDSFRYDCLLDVDDLSPTAPLPLLQPPLFTPKGLVTDHRIYEE